jgi:hypothetical protein
MPSVNKLIVTNDAALRAKYLKGYARVAEALKRLVAADEARGLVTRVVRLDDAKAMKAMRGAAVTDPESAREAKAAIDAAYRAIRPEYLMILGAPDIVAHQNLLNPVYAPDDDDDRYAPSDLPYACEDPYSQKIADFRGPTRVVGRLPDLNAYADAAYFVRVLGVAAQYRERSAAKYAAFFGLTALQWQKSTALSLANTFGSAAAMHRSPPEGPGWKASQLDALTHFINCHGGSGTPEFYGQRGESYPVAMRSSNLGGKVRNGTVVAAECCYGAQIYDPSYADGEMGICNRYLRQGAYAFFGSSTIAYGPSEGNGSADLICQFFIQRVLAGASTGRAALEARLKFVLHASHLDPTDLKTLAQFNLMGDPAIHVIGKAQHALQRTKGWHRAFEGNGEAVARVQRRNRLLRDGAMLNSTTGAAKPAASGRPSPRVREALAKAVRDAGLKPGEVFSFGVDDPAPRTLGRKELRDTTPSAFYVMSACSRRRAGEPPRHVVVVATVQDGRIVRLRRLHRRGG